MTKKFYIADTHFGHANVIKYSNRPFNSAEHMEEEMICRWNEAVGKNDDVYHLGDFAFKADVESIVKRLNGRIHLIWGNHDSDKVRKLSCWASSRPYAEVNDDGSKLILCHYAMRVWNRSHYGSLMLYGHSHGSLPGNSQSLDVGVDCWDYRPVDIHQIRERMETLPPFKQEDGH